MIKRIFVNDGWELADAIKNRKESTLIDRFQEYWKERCYNENYISNYYVLCVLMQFAADNFKKEDWIEYKEHFRFHNLFSNETCTINITEMINAYLSVINLMQMFYIENKRKETLIPKCWNPDRDENNPCRGTD